MRRVFVALLTALTVVIGLGAFVGTASAATPVLTANEGDACVEAGVAGVIKAGVCVTPVVTTTTPTTTPVPTPHPCGPGTHWDARDKRCEDNRGGPVFGGGHNNWNDRLDGRYFRLDRGPALDVCSADTYSVFLSRNSVYRDRISRFLDDRRFTDLRRADCGVVVSNDGDCTTVTTYYNNYRNSVNRWNDLSRRYNTRDLVQRYRGDLDSAARDRLRWANEFNRTRSTVHTTCNVPTTLNTIVVQAPPVTYALPAAPAPAPVAAPAPSSVSGGSIPQGSVDTGGWSAAAVLAHNRAV
jgi:hypothetical protein